MDETFLTFHIFSDPDSAEKFAASLTNMGIEAKLVYDSVLFQGKSKDVRVKIRQDDFVQATNILENYQQSTTVKLVDESFLEDCTDEELREIIAKPDDWSQQDVQQAIKILKERTPSEIAGTSEVRAIPTIKEDKIVKQKVRQGNVKLVKIRPLKKEKPPKIKKPKTEATWYNRDFRVNILPYIIAVLLSPIGLFIGWQMAYSKKTLPDGTEAFVNDENVRIHGERVLLVSIIILIALVPLLITRVV
ncbi:MAG TPA: hypothetical protein VFQ58_07720 [Flavisolibacter sp.]|jgi:hypothetical protein|nr:hypothetical protein [Flavisolibacter sp.]